MQQIKERLTSQKKIVLDYLMGVTCHPTAEKVYHEAKKKLPQISQGTVYRILNGLRDSDKAQIIWANGVAHFDGNAMPHSHFVCQKCNRVFDVFDQCAKCDILKNKKLKVGKIKTYVVKFYGICKQCKK
jgi:Fe2+ or Zn2+ uptake regulation protein